MNKKQFPVWSALLALAISHVVAVPARSATYDIDPAHSFILFKAGHLNIGWVIGRFNEFSGQFDYDPSKGEDAQKASVAVDVGSVDSGHAERDRHLKNDDILDVDSHPDAQFVSTGFKGGPQGGTLSGMLTLWGQAAPVDIAVTFNNEGNDPWGGYRAGFMGETTLNLADFGFSSRLASEVDLEIYLEGVRR